MAAVGIEEIALPSFIQQPALVMLAMNLDQPTGHVRKARGGHGLIVHSRGRATRGTDLAHDDQRLRQAIEERLDAGARGPVADQADVRPSTQREPERIDDQALASTGLPRQDVEPWIQRDPETIDQPEIGDGELQERADVDPSRVVHGVLRDVDEAIPGFDHEGSNSTFLRSRSQNGRAP